MIVSWRLTDQVVMAVHQAIAAVTWYFLLPLLLSELLSQCVWHLQDATQLALKIVTSYGLSDIGITTYAAPGASLGFMRKSFEVLPLDGCSSMETLLSYCTKPVFGKLQADSAAVLTVHQRWCLVSTCQL